MPFSDLNPNQLSAVLTTTGPVLIIAGPGSGKTHTLVARIVHLIRDHNVSPDQIMVSTFTEKAAVELITRVSNQLGKEGHSIDLNEMYIGTLHSICLRIVDAHREFTHLKSNYTIWDQFDQQYIVYQRINLFRDVENSEEIMGKESSGRWIQARNLCSWVNKVSEEILSVNDLITSHDKRVIALGHLYQRYQSLLDEENTLDFSTIQVEAYRLLTTQLNVLSKLQEKIKYVMIDEYQDTNTVQEGILRTLIGINGNICVVGDDDQGLYRFRGATIRNILEFPDRFSDGTCHRITLSTNYRSHPTIIDFYNRWMKYGMWTINGTTFRFQKTIEPPTNKEFPQVPTVIRLGSEAGIEAWTKEVLKFLQYLRSKGQITNWNQIAFLFRSVKHQSAEKLSELLEQNGIPVYSPRSNFFFKRREIRLIFGALIALFPQLSTLLQEQQEDSDAHNIWMYYQDCLNIFIDELDKPENATLLQWWNEHALYHANLQEEANYNYSRLFYQLLGFPLFANFLGEEAIGGVIDSRPARNLAQFSQLLARFEYLHNINTIQPKYFETDLRRLFKDYFRFLFDGGIEEFEDPEEVAPSECISFLTIHQSKGLEFPVVIVGSLWARPTKSHSELDVYLQENHYWKEPLEPFEHIKNFDFWRQFYTAFSRARNLLVLTADEHKGQWANPSPQLSEIYYSVPSWRTIQKALTTLPIDEVRSSSLKHRFGFTSHIAFFENCPRQYQFFRDLDFAPARQGNLLFGVVIHQTIEHIHRAAIRGETDKINDLQIEEWFHDCYRHLANSMKSYLNKQGLESALRQVKAYATRHQGQWDQIQEAEVDVSLVKEDYILTGTVDLIRGQNGTVEIIDFKSDKKPDVNAAADADRLERYHRQLDVYAHIVSNRYGHTVSMERLYYTTEVDGNPYVSWEMDENRLSETIETIDKVVARIENKDYSLPKLPETQCKRCDMRNHCELKGPDRSK